MFGLSFGAKTQKTSSNTKIDKTETVNQNQTGTNSSSGVTSANSATQSAGSTTGQQAATQSGTNKSTASQTGQSTQTTSSFSSPTLGAIEQAVSELFGKVGAAAPVSAFDKDSFVADTVRGASNDISTNLESNIDQLVTNLGGSTGNNSMSALLSNRMRGDAAAELAGIRANATSQAEEIARANTLAAAQVSGQDQGFLGQLLGALKGGVTTTTGTESTTSAQDQQTQNTSNSTTAEQQLQQQQQQSTQTQQLIEMMSQLLSGTTHTVGTEDMKGKTKSMGGGISAGF